MITPALCQVLLMGGVLTFDSDLREGFTLDMRERMREMNVPYQYETRDEFEWRMKRCNPCDAQKKEYVRSKKYEDALHLWRRLDSAELIHVVGKDYAKDCLAMTI